MLLGIQHLDGHTGVSGRLLLPEQPLLELQLCSRWMTARSTKALKAGRQICLVVCFGGARRDLTQEDWLITALSRCGREAERERKPEDDGITCGREGETERA